MEQAIWKEIYEGEEITLSGDKYVFYPTSKRRRPKPYCYLPASAGKEELDRLRFFIELKPYKLVNHLMDSLHGKITKGHPKLKEYYVRYKSPRKVIRVADFFSPHIDECDHQIVVDTTNGQLYVDFQVWDFDISIGYMRLYEQVQKYLSEEWKKGE